MKKLYYVLAASALFGCNSRYVEFEGKTPGLNEGVFVIKNLNDSTMYGENIADGKFHLKQMLEYPGYHKMLISDGKVKSEKLEPFEVYIETGKYTIETEPGKLFKYPKITSPSKIQNELTAFYTIKDNLSAGIHQEVAKAKAALDDKKAKFKSSDEYTAMINTLSEAMEKERGFDAKAFQEFVNKYPESEIAAHLMAKLDYENDPVNYLAMFNRLSPTAKNSEEGREIGEQLNRLVKLVPGAKAPALAGNTPDGKPFDASKFKGKFVLVDFWRSGNMASRKYHQEMFKLLNNLKKFDFTIVSVSIDQRPDWWDTALKDDRMTWPQVSDLKGDDSQNVTNWAITKVPTYYLLDENWHIVERDVSISRVTFLVMEKAK